ncbi:CapA family protein [Nocardioides sp. Arc9.136]|uniref:CapA family protein n=1 Tax=Nocardioides sp. Arc9.136 TaxID=2996826 RepID=UPI00266704D5|nr:CapA family protein [Nocardioides sp. Arc9.136]WKN48207.1 CapA family protein [Nocardioides sp. Arc9.136]
MRRWGAGLVGAVLLLTGCTGEASQPREAAEPGSSPVTAAEPPATDPDEDRRPEQERRLVVVGHATEPQLRLSRGTAARLVAGEVTRWRGRRVVTTGRVERRLRAVEGDPGSLAVVPLADVRPTVVAALVAGRDPVRDDPRAVGLTVVGDVMLVRGVPDPWGALAPTARRLRSADVTVGNLESTLSLAGAPTQGGDSFGATPALLRPLRRAGFDVLSLANNHAGDHGTGALLDTVRTLRRSPVGVFGAGPDRSAASRPAYRRVGDVRLAFVGFNAIGETPQATPTSPGALGVRMPPRTGPLVEADVRHVERTVARAQERADVVVVLPHWGTQYTHEPVPVQRTVARRLVAAGADLVVGGHPHWVQGVDAVAGVPVVHSLGNFVFDMDFPDEEVREGVVLEATLWGAELKALRLVPYAMATTDFAPRFVTGDRAAGILDDVWSTSTGPFAR